MYKVFGTPVCPHCQAAKNLLTAKGQEFIYFDLTNAESKTPSRAEFEALAGTAVRTVPIIIRSNNKHSTLADGDEFVGGFASLQKLFS